MSPVEVVMSAEGADAVVVRGRASDGFVDVLDALDLVVRGCAALNSDRTDDAAACFAQARVLVVASHEKQASDPRREFDIVVTLDVVGLGS